MSFASSFSAGLQLAELKKQRTTDKAIEEAGNFATKAMEAEKQARAFSAQAQTPPPTEVVRDPSIYQQGDSLGLQGYQTGNKPIQTTVPTAPSGYMTPSNEVNPGFDTGGYYETPPNTSANPSTEQTLLGNYGTTAAFKGETPTKADILNMQQDTQVPFRGPQDQSIVDLAKVSPSAKEIPPAPPKAFDTFSEKISAADRAKESYDYNMRVIRRLQETGNAKAALDYQTKVYNSELTLSQADHQKFTTAASIAKQVGNVASNTLEAMQEPGADVNKLYFDAMDKARDMYGYQGKIPFSLDPNENIRTLNLLQKDALTVSEKSELGIKESAAQWKKTSDALEMDIKQQKLGLDKLLAVNTLTKTQQEIATSQFNRLNETVKSQFQAINSINPTISDEDKKAIKVSYDANLKDLQKYSKALNIPMPDVGSVGATNVSLGNKKAPPAVTNNTGVPTAQSNVNTQQVNSAFPEDIVKEASVQDTAGGYVNPTSNTTTATKPDTARIKFLKSKINELTPKTRSPESSVAISNPVADVVNLGERVVSSVSNADIFNPTKAGQKERERKAKELKKYQDELDTLTK